MGSNPKLFEIQMDRVSFVKNSKCNIKIQYDELHSEGIIERNIYYV